MAGGLCYHKEYHHDKAVPLKVLLRDVGTFSLAAICASLLSQLFEDDNCHREFKVSFMEKLVSYLGLDSNCQVKSTMVCYLDNHDMISIESYSKVVLEEAALEGSGTAIVQDLIQFCIGDGVYDARSRVLMQSVAVVFSVTLDDIQRLEEAAIDRLVETDHVITQEELQLKAKAYRRRRIKRGLIIAAATIGGGALLGLTGGLAAPFMAAGAGAFIGGAGAAALASTAGMAIIGSLFGAAGAGLTGYKMKKRVGEIEEFAFEVLTPGDHLHTVIAVSGWIADDKPDAFKEPWVTLLHSNEQYCLRYESRYLLELGRTLQRFVSFALQMAVTEALKTTILAGVISAVLWPSSLLSLANIIDLPWNVCLRRSEDVGRILAETLLCRQQGRRPVTLIGYSMGARVIFYCLQEMGQRKGCEGIVEDVILLGAPVSNCSKEWQKLSRVVAGKIINGYCRGDWLLNFLHRTSSVTMSIAGVKPIDWIDRRMINVELTEIVSGHFDYGNKIGEILTVLGIRTDLETLFENRVSIRKSRSDLPERSRHGDQTVSSSMSEPAIRGLLSREGRDSSRSPTPET